MTVNFNAQPKNLELRALDVMGAEQPVIIGTIGPNGLLIHSWSEMDTIKTEFIFSGLCEICIPIHIAEDDSAPEYANTKMLFREAIKEHFYPVFFESKVSVPFYMPDHAHDGKPYTTEREVSLLYALETLLFYGIRNR